MEFIGPRFVEKTIGTKYSVEWDKHLHTVTVIYKHKPQTTFTFDKMTKSLNFYAAIKLVKDINRLNELYERYR